MHLIDKLIFTTHESIVNFYCSAGGNDLPHYMHMDRKRMNELFDFLYTKVATEHFRVKIEEAKKDINKLKS